MIRVQGLWGFEIFFPGYTLLMAFLDGFGVASAGSRL